MNEGKGIHPGRYLSLRSEGPPLRWPLVVKAEIKPASLLRNRGLICKCDTGDESASIALDNAWSGAIQHLLSQRSGHQLRSALCPRSQPRDSAQARIWRVTKAATETNTLITSNRIFNHEGFALVQWRLCLLAKNTRLG